jgi:hypothetical protein
MDDQRDIDTSTAAACCLSALQAADQSDTAALQGGIQGLTALLSSPMPMLEALPVVDLDLDFAHPMNVEDGEETGQGWDIKDPHDLGDSIDLHYEAVGVPSRRVSTSCRPSPVQDALRTLTSRTGRPSIPTTFPRALRHTQKVEQAHDEIHKYLHTNGRADIVSIALDQLKKERKRAVNDKSNRLRAPKLPKGIRRKTLKNPERANKLKAQDRTRLVQAYQVLEESSLDDYCLELHQALDKLMEEHNLESEVTSGTTTRDEVYGPQSKILASNTTMPKDALLLPSCGSQKAAEETSGFDSLSDLGADPTSSAKRAFLHSSQEVESHIQASPHRHEPLPDLALEEELALNSDLLEGLSEDDLAEMVVIINDYQRPSSVQVAGLDDVAVAQGDAFGFDLFP